MQDSRFSLSVNTAVMKIVAMNTDAMNTAVVLCLMLCPGIFTAIGVMS